MNVFRRTIRLRAAALGVTVLGGATAALIANPAAAADLGSLVTSVTCSVTGSNWCISGNNTSSGIGVIGTSKTGTGLRGTSTSQYGLKATSTSGDAIFAQTTTGSTAISATAGNGFGVSGATTTGSAGVLGTSPSSVGVYGEATVTTSSSSKGVYGYSNDGYGVYGSSPGSVGYGVEGVGGGLGVIGTSSTGTGVEALSSSSSHPALSVMNSAGGNGIDVTAQSSVCPNGLTCSAVTANSKDGYAFLGSTGNDGVPLELNNSDTGNLIFWVSNTGNVNYSGTLAGFARTRGGAMVQSYSAKTSMPVVEDFGTAQLAAGAASVALDPTFASSIDPRAGYRVFLSPNGDTRGLYTASKTPAGFVVRETGGGRGTLSFDYRIVATALGQSGQRMAVINPASMPHAKFPAAPAAPKADRPLALPARP
jgi:hypothetical protein